MPAAGTRRLIVSVVLLAGCGDESLFGPDRNQAPEITGVTLSPPVVPTGGSAQVRVEAKDPDGDRLFFRYAAEAGTVTPDPNDPAQAAYVHSGAPGAADRITVTVTDTSLAVASAVAEVRVQGNRAPGLTVLGGGSCHPPCSVPVEAVAEDPDGDPLTYAWSGCAAGQAPRTRCRLTSVGPATAVVVVQDTQAAATVGSVTAEGVNERPVVSGGRVFQTAEARFAVNAGDPDGDPLTCGWRGNCQCTGAAGSFSLSCALPSGLLSCFMRFTCVDPFGASGQTVFQLAP